jgi:tetratricopeptide (TPR) repeat protein
VSRKTGEPRPTVFISYSHQDEGWKDRLVTNLKALDLQSVEVWDDRRIVAGEDWFAEIQAAMNRAAVAVLLISTDFLASGFIRGTEVPRLLRRRQEEGLRIIPLFVRPSPWTSVDWLSATQGRPKDAKPLSTCRKPQADKHLADLALEIQSCLTAPTASPLSRGREGGRWERGPGGEVQPRLDLSRLPIPGPLLIGREIELARLDAAWENPNTRVLTLVAFGGTGKSALVSRWLQNLSLDGYRGARRVLDWSFYSQGTEDRVTSADRFLDHALEFFGDPDPKKGAPRDRGLRLADLIRQEKTLLVLDGVEPLQHSPNHGLAGRLKDPGLAALLKALAAGSQGLCVVTTRERIDDLEGLPAAPQEDLEALTPEAGAELLKALGVQGKNSELLAASKRFGNHALTLALLGGYLSRACGSDIRRCKEVDLAGAAEKKGGHALRVIGTYASWLGEGPELAALRLLGLFDRPAQPKAIAALRAKPAIFGFTEPLVDLGEEDWQLALSSLREHGLLLPADPNQPGTLDAHPLVRVYFQEDLETRRPEAWRAGNLRLYEHLQKEAPDLPETLDAMEPLFTAVIHGCRAGRHQETLDEVYWRRIRRGTEMYATKKLGAFGSELSAMSGFFDRPWDQPSARLTSRDQAFVLNEAGLDLRALGRLAEAVPPMEAALAADTRREDWKSAAVEASNLSELTLTLGKVGRAVSFGKQSVDLADRSCDAFERLSDRAVLADALHQSGQLKESAETFREAEVIQAEEKPQYPHLASLQGYRYCDLLLSRGEPEAYEEVRERAEQAMEAAERNHWLLDIALDHLSLGRAHLGLGDFARAAEHLDHAVEGLRRAGQEDDLPRGLLARAALRRFQKDWPGAEVDLSETLELAERGSMRLFECDAHLEWARLSGDRGDWEGAERHVARARKLVEETGYSRRRGELEELEGQLR